jgi:protease-4
MKAKNAGVIIFICIIAASLAVAIIAVVNVRTVFPLRASDSAVLPSTSKKILANDYIARVYISGIIQSSNAAYNQRWLLETIKKLRNDKKNAALIVSINSPGGTVYESDEVYLALRDYAQSGKPVWAYLEQMAASGGYYIACGADHIVANRNTLTGSIGVIAGQSIDLTGLMERYGIKVTTFASGKNKNMLGFDSPITEEQRAIMQSISDDCYEQFVQIVAEARNMSANRVRARADGRIYTARQALDAQLVDAIGTFDEAVGQLASELQTADKKIDTLDFRYSPRTTVWDFFGVRFNLEPEMELLKRIPDISFPAYLFAQ